MLSDNSIVSKMYSKTSYLNSVGIFSEEVTFIVVELWVLCNIFPLVFFFLNFLIQYKKCLFDISSMSL